MASCLVSIGILFVGKANNFITVGKFYYWYWKLHLGN